MKNTAPDLEPGGAPGEALAAGNAEVVLDAAAAFARTLTHPKLVGRAAGGFAAEFGRVAVGRSQVEPARGDRRFADPAWKEHPGYHRLMQTYLAFCESVGEVVEGADVTWRTRERARFAAGVLTSTIAPTNTLLGNPAALKRAFDTGGASLIKGAKNFVSDLRHNGGMPKQVDDSQFTVGENIAATPGAVIFRNEVLELIQYTPSTAKVRETPVLLIPPQINKYYFMDMAPGRSFVEHAVSRGLTMFVVSWRNPSKEQGDWNLDTYGRAIIDAMDAVKDITGQEELITISLCAGGITTSTVLSYLASIGDTRVKACSFLVTLLDWDVPAAIGAFNSGPLLAIAKRKGKKQGVLDARSLGSTFTWMRPDDLVWNYWVNNYLMGNKPPAFDILAWNDDKTNLPSALHRQFLKCFKSNILTQPGELQVLGHGVDLGSIKSDAYVVGGFSDHLTPWQGCYRSTQLFGGHTEFVLSPTGHIQTPVSPPGPKAHYFTGPTPPADPEMWRAQSTRHEGTWWDHWADWVIARAGDEKPAATRLGSKKNPVLVPAPGTYVHQPA
ncbi:MAG: alpha/beta fold hydrolase [Sporichthyaceae bacterium]